MCGIVGYTGMRSAWPIILDSLTGLEYRGYDSAGIAVLNDSGQIAVAKSAGSVGNLSGRFPPLNGRTAIGHTRWATHGPPVNHNAHPHVACDDSVAVVHNGIVENHRSLREELMRNGHHFRSQTDTEVISHMIEELLREGCTLLVALWQVGRKLEGPQVIAAMQQHRQAIVATRIRQAGSLAVIRNGTESIICSDLSALNTPTMRAHQSDLRAAFVDEGETVWVTSTGILWMDRFGNLTSDQHQTCLLYTSPSPRDS